MIVGTYSTGLVSKGPCPRTSGMQEGWLEICWVMGSFHGATRFESQPHPGPRGSEPLTGLSPVKPSRVPATSSMCAPHDGRVAVGTVWSFSAYVEARDTTLGPWLYR